MSVMVSLLMGVYKKPGEKTHLRPEGKRLSPVRVEVQIRKSAMNACVSPKAGHRRLQARGGKGAALASS
ncbi:MAG: hypothetical protein ACREYE_02215 [Gammaproteobacteria bacterium]